MKTLILAGGYGTRLYPLTLNIPKALLQVGGKTILECIVQNVFSISSCDYACIVTNEKFYHNFTEWIKTPQAKKVIGNKKLEILNDGTTSDENKLGAIGDINFALERLGIKEEILVLGSDNLFDFDLRKFIDFCVKKGPHASIALYDVKNIKKASLYGIAILDDKTSEIKDFQEKPKEPKSTLAATAIYYYPKEKVALFKDYMKSDLPKDAPGNFVKWLYTKEKVYGYIFREKWYDIGDKASLDKADEEFRKINRNERTEK